MFNRFVGIPYLFNGDTLDGCDCWGLVKLVQKELFNKDLGKYEHAGLKPIELAGLVNENKNNEPVQKIEQPGVGDLILLRVFGHPCHVGIVVGGGKMLHSLHNTDSCIESYLSGFWPGRLEGFYRVN